MSGEHACRECTAPLRGKGARGLCDACYARARRSGELGELELPGSAVPGWVDISWHVDALCAEVDAEIFFPEKGQSTREGKKVCRSCVVRAECLEYALETGQRFGIYGGTSERERRRLLGLPEDDAEEASAA